MPDAIAELRALVSTPLLPTRASDPIEELRALVAPSTRAIAAPTTDEMEVIARAPTNARPFSLKPPAPPSPDTEPLVRSRTGSLYRPTPVGTMPILDAPAEGIPQVAQGVRNLRTGEGGRMNAASDVIEGGLKVSEPLMAGAALANPLMAVRALVSGFGAQKATEAGARAVGLSDDATRLASNVAGIVAPGALEAGIRARPRIMEALRSDPLTTGAKPEVPAAAAVNPVEELRTLVDPREPPPPVEEPIAEPPTPTEDVVDRMREKMAAGDTLGSPEARAAFEERQRVESVRQSPIDELRSLVGEDEHAVQEHVADEGRVRGVSGAGDEGPREDLGARDTEHQEPAGAREEAEAPVGAEAAGDQETPGTEVAPEWPANAADLTPEHLREVRRIVHELDAMPFTPRLLKPAKYGGGLEHVEGTGGEGAKVYHDVLEVAPGTSRITRGQMQEQLERYLGGKPPTNAVKGALEIARLRKEGKTNIPGDGRLSVPELPDSAGDVRTRFEPRPERPPVSEPILDNPDAESLPTNEQDVDNLGDWFKQQAVNEAPTNPIEELARAINEAPKVAEAPFSLSGEAAETGEVQPDLFKPEKPKFGDWQKAQAQKGDVTLQSTLVPGAKEFAEQDLAPIVRGGATIGREIKNALSPQTASPNAQWSADIVRGAKAKIANASAVEEARMNPSRLSQGMQILRGESVSPNVMRHFRSQSDAANIANISTYERTGKFADAPEGYSEFYKKSMTEAAQLLERAYGGDIEGKVENYVRRAFKFGSPKAEAEGTAYLSTQLRSLSANKSPLKGRVLDMPLEEALENMKARGIDVRPATTNPEALRQWSIANARQAVAYKKAWADLEAGGLIHFTKAGGRVPDGFVPLEDRIATRFFPTEKGLVQAGRYYADQNVARVLNNAVSKGLEGNAGFRAARTINNAMNQMQLGISGFHATGTAINAGISDLALGVRKLARGDAAGGASAIGRSVVPGASFARDLLKGRNLIEGLKANNPEAYEVLNQKINPSGARLHIEERYQNKAFENMRRAFANSNYLGAAARLPLAVVEQTAKPLMSYAIPRVKIGALLDMLYDIDERMPDATPEAKARAYAAASDSIDNRFGQVVHDNLFWNKTASDLSQLSFRSVGWNLGTVRELGGGLADTRKLAHGEVTDRLLYTAALPVYVGMIGAVYQYLHTGEKPSEVKDYFYPKNGRTEPNGLVSRTTLPTYMKDVEAYASHPLATIGHKQSPILDFVGALVRNEDYFGDLIRNPDDPTAQQLQQLGAYALKEIAPFSVQQLQRSTKENATSEGKAESLLGFVKAPASMERTPAETLMHDFIGPQSGRTPEQVERSGVKKQLRDAEKKGDEAAAKKVIDSGMLGRRDVRQAVRSADLSGFEAGFKRLTLEQAIKVYEVATPKQRANIRGLLVRKWQANVRELSDEKRPALSEAYDRAVDLPYDKPSLTAALQPQP